MYVRDLEMHCLLLPNEGRSWKIDPLNKTNQLGNYTQQEEAVMELHEAGIACHGTIRYDRPTGRAGWFKSPAIYLGVKQLSYFYFGVKKQHTFMVGDTLFVMDGYQLKNCKKF